MVRSISCEMEERMKERGRVTSNPGVADFVPDRRDRSGLSGGGGRIHPRKRGVALVVVLFLITILGILIIAILSISTNELESARKYADGIEVRQLNDTAVSVASANCDSARGRSTRCRGRKCGHPSRVH